ncbi:hypothetical protein QF205_10905 [Luteimonas composti]|uniref:Primosomal replication protein PriB/PriC domain protein n=1 Tax=Luteimonas composti TaxID=398257 RepID=A0ABT6MSE0_9GAMM|nr:hypothetical protein [Luteimonas composti]MDH7453571.1 hypothetical protein [Luteimonas composti]
MSTAQERLDLYLAAEARILTAGFSVQLDVRRRQEAELAEIRKAIASLQREVAAEQGPRPGRGSLRYVTTVFNR